MADKSIQVNVTASKTKSILVNPSGQDVSVTASPDTARIWARTSKNWAISDNIVENTDYSSKYYAKKSSESADESKVYAEAGQATYNRTLEISENANNEIVATKNEALTAINERFEQGIGDGINQITVLVNDSIAEYTEISNQIKQENSEASKLARDWATSEVLVDNIDYSAKYYAEKAKDNSGIFYDELTDKDIDVEIISGGYATKSELELGLDTKQDKGDYALRNEIPDITPLATKQELTQGLNTKQPKGNYALVEDIPTQVSELENDSNYATQTQVLQAIASIPQFKLSIVEALPATGEKMTLYLVPKEGTNNDVYDEYIWIEQTTSFEHLGTTAVDLTDYVKKTDYAQGGAAGIVKASNTFACGATNGYLQTTTLPVGTRYDNLSQYAFIGKGTLENIKNDLVKRAVTENDIELTDDEKTSARTWLGAVGYTDYAGIGGKAGVIKVSAAYGFAVAPSNGYLAGISRTLEQFKTIQSNSVISKGTLDNVLTQYSKTVLTTEADYNALETKDSNTLYLIEE